MSKEKLKVFGGEYPILTSFRDGFHLIAMPGGPTIAKSYGVPKGGMLSVIWCQDSDLVPGKIMREAIQWYVEKSWPLVKNSMAPDAIPNWRAKNPREGDLFVKHGHFCRVESVGDGLVRYENVVAGDVLPLHRTCALEDWHRLVDMTMSAGAKFFSFEVLDADSGGPWKSCAIWPAECCPAIGNYSDDTLGTKGRAKAICQLLHENGFGGDRKFFPVKTWVEPCDEVAPVKRGAA